jgi:hypothetical protein
MKSRTIVILAALAVTLAFVLAGCAFVPMTIEARLNRFIETLNTTGRADVYTNFSATETADYGPITSGAYWDAPFPAGGAVDPRYSITNAVDPSNPLAVLVTIAGPPLFGGPKGYEFVMVNEGVQAEDWKIHELWIWDAGSSAYVELIK